MDAACREVETERPGRLGQRARPGGAADLVCDDAQRLPLLHQSQHGGDEVAATGRVEPGSAQHDRLGVRGLHRLFAIAFGLAIDRKRTGMGLGQVGRGRRTVEDEIGRDMHQPCTLRGRNCSDMARTHGIHGLRQLGLAFGLVDGGVGGGVDHQLWALGGEGL